MIPVHMHHGDASGPAQVSTHADRTGVIYLRRLPQRWPSEREGNHFGHLQEPVDHVLLAAPFQPLR